MEPTHFSQRNAKLRYSSRQYSAAREGSKSRRSKVKQSNFVLASPLLSQTQNIADVVAGLLISNQAFVTLVGASVASNPSFIASAGQDIASNTQFIQTITELVSQNPQVLQTIATTLENDVEFTNNLSIIINQDPAFQTIVQQNILSSQTFIQDLVQALEASGLSGQSPQPENTVFVSPMFLPQPSEGNPQFFNSLSAAFEYIENSRTDINEPWGIVMFPGVYDAAILPLDRGSLPSQKHEDDLRTVEMLFKRLLSYCAAKKSLSKQAQLDAQDVLRLLKSNRLVEDVMDWSKATQSYDPIEFEQMRAGLVAVESTISPQASSALMDEPKETKVNSDEWKDNKVDISTQHDDILERIRGYSITKQDHGASKQHHHASRKKTFGSLSDLAHQWQQIQISVFDTLIASCVDEIIGIQRGIVASVKGTDASNLFVPPTLDVPINVSIRAAIQGTVFSNHDMTFSIGQTLPSTPGISNVNTVSGICFFDCNIAWDSTQYDGLAEMRPGLVFSKCSTLASSVGNVNLSLNGSGTPPANRLPHVTWQNCRNVTFGDISMANYGGRLQFLDCHNVTNANLEMSLLQLTVSNCTNIFLGQSSISMTPVQPLAASQTTITLNSSQGGFGQMIDNSQVANIQYVLSNAYWQGAPSTRSVSNSLVSLQSSFLSVQATVSWLNFSEFTMSGSIIVVPQLTLYNVGNLRLLESVILTSTLSLRPIPSNAWVLEGCYLSSIIVGPLAPSTEALNLSIQRCNISQFRMVETVNNTVPSRVDLASCHVSSVFYGLSNSILSFDRCDLGACELGSNSVASSFMQLSASSCGFYGSITTVNNASASTAFLRSCSLNGVSIVGQIWVTHLLDCVVTSPSSGSTPSLIEFGPLNNQIIIENLACKSIPPSLRITTTNSDPSSSGSMVVKIAGSTIGLFNFDILNLDNPSLNVEMTFDNSKFGQITFTNPRDVIRPNVSFDNCTMVGLQMNTSAQELTMANSTVSGSMQFVSGDSITQFSSSNLGQMTCQQVSGVLAPVPAIFNGCTFARFTDNSNDAKTFESCTFSGDYVAPTINSPINPRGIVTFDNCTFASSALLQRNLYFSFCMSTVSGSVRITYPVGPLSPSPRNRGSYNFIQCTLNDITDADTLSNSFFVNDYYARFYMNRCTVHGSMSMTKMPVAVQGTEPSGGFTQFPYIHGDSEGPAIIINSYINNLVIDTMLTATTIERTTQSWGLSRTVVRGGLFRSGLCQLAINSEQDSNLIPTTFTNTGAIIVGFSSPSSPTFF